MTRNSLSFRPLVPSCCVAPRMSHHFMMSFGGISRIAAMDLSFPRCTTVDNMSQTGLGNRDCIFRKEG
jgi:hypothetical protein